MIFVDIIYKIPHHIEGMKLLATIYAELHVYDDAEFLLESCLEFEADNLDTMIQYVNILIKRQKYGLASKMQRRCIKIS